MPEQYKLYPYRWIVLAVFMLTNLTIQVLWISYAPITGPAAAFYGVTDLQIGFLAMSFMIAFIPLSLPVSWVIDTYGFRLAVGIGAAMMGLFGVLRGLAGENYSLVVWSTIGIAAAQPFPRRPFGCLTCEQALVELVAAVHHEHVLAIVLDVAARVPGVGLEDVRRQEGLVGLVGVSVLSADVQVPHPALQGLVDVRSLGQVKRQPGTRQLGELEQLEILAQ